MDWIWERNYRSEMEDIIRYSGLLYDRNLVSAAGGNVSERCGSDMLITASNAPLREITPDSLVLCDLKGAVIEKNQHLRPSKETLFHAGVYRVRPEVRCVIHVHPAYSVVWTLQKKPLPLYTESAKLKLIDVPIIPDAAPGSQELAENVVRTVAAAPANITAFLMEGHGILALGRTMQECFHQVELLEDTAKIAVLQALLTR
ncbi:MAG: class II aldolase/adducin family protein [Oscillospiraceae bacterium]|nr:class II aldolase/adducin family protein [Oscillospiraceae bacterium]MCI6026732.1 class II aldolase/adducin family protein [Oscillospiraceae bacterium]MDY3218511.1 class II aldolase/adducin family protein [Candidatus Fimivivens sp.]SFI86974.1 L-fuculose-phosphate aldolase [Ruminococcaceae bacterium D5]